MLMNMKSNSKVGKAITETASIAYTGELLPAGTASYGSELGINPECNSLTYWNSFSGGAISVVNGNLLQIQSTGASCAVNQTNPYLPIVSGKTYYVEVTAKTSKDATIEFYNGTGYTVIGSTIAGVSKKVSGVVSATGNYSYQIVKATSSTTDLTTTWETISVKEVLINPDRRYLKNSGKDKTPALVESGQGKFFNGTNQYINTGATPNDSEGTFISRFTYASGAIQKIMAGMNYSNNRCYMGINASGKIGVGFGANTYDTLFSPDVLVAGRSYHVAFRYSGSTYWLFVDSVLKATGTITGLTTFAGTSFFIGALNNGGTASNHFNSVIDETYYYDVALTDAQIEALYKYPEKVKEYNGGIVPDIGNEANCKLFLPMCESSGSNVVNVAVAKQEEGLYNGAIQCSSADGGAGGEVSVLTSLGGGAWNLKVTTVGTNTSSPYVSVNGTRPLETMSKTIDIEFDAVVTSGTCYITKFYNGTMQITLSTPYLVKNGHNVLTVQTRANNSAVAYLYLDGTKLFNVDISNVTSKASVSYPLVNYTTAMHTSAAKLSYGAQCTAWKRDSLGVLLGMSNGLSFDGAVSVKYPVVALANAIPDTTPIVMEAIVYCEATEDYKFVMGSNLLRLGIDADGEPWCRIGSFQGRITPSPNTTTKSYYHHIAVQSNGTTLNAWVDGVQYRTNIAITVGGADGANFVLGSSGWDKPYKRIAGTPKIHKGAEYAKFNITKAWANAQKTIAKLGA